MDEEKSSGKVGGRVAAATGAAGLGWLGSSIGMVGVFGGIAATLPFAVVGGILGFGAYKLRQKTVENNRLRAAVGKTDLARVTEPRASLGKDLVAGVVEGYVDHRDRLAEARAARAKKPLRTIKLTKPDGSDEPK